MLNMKIIRDTFIIAMLKSLPDLKRQPLLLTIIGMLSAFPLFFIVIFGGQLSSGIIGAMVATVGFIGLNRIFESIPSKNLGVLYCCGTRYESGTNIYDEIRYFGRKRKIFHVHLRNVRGRIPITGGYEEVDIDDGEINLYRVLKTLREINYRGVINPDHVPTYVGDRENKMIAWAHAVGYVQGLLATL